MAQEKQKTKDKDAHFKEWLLGCSKEHKIFLMKQAIRDNNVAAYFALTKVFLETPISQGGIPSSEIPNPADQDLHVNYNFGEKKVVFKKTKE
jgi:hypothetical protein